MACKRPGVRVPLAPRFHLRRTTALPGSVSSASIASSMASRSFSAPAFSRFVYACSGCGSNSTVAISRAGGRRGGAGLTALGVLAALTYLGGDLRWQLVVAGVIAGVLEPLVFLEANNHGGGGAVVGEDGLLTPVPCPADDLAQMLAGVADRHLTQASNCTTWGMRLVVLSGQVRRAVGQLRCRAA